MPQGPVAVAVLASSFQSSTHRLGIPRLPPRLLSLPRVGSEVAGIASISEPLGSSCVRYRTGTEGRQEKTIERLWEPQVHYTNSRAPRDWSIGAESDPFPGFRVNRGPAQPLTRPTYASRRIRFTNPRRSEDGFHHVPRRAERRACGRVQRAVDRMTHRSGSAFPAERRWHHRRRRPLPHLHRPRLSFRRLPLRRRFREATFGLLG